MTTELPEASRPSRYLIMNADDFGASEGINRGIVDAHVRGVVTSSSLMVNMPATAKAVARAASLPRLSLGLHVNFTNEGDPVLDLDDLPAAERELANQYRRFCDLVGRPPTHMDSHHNVHRLPGLLPAFLDFAGAQGVPMREHSPARYYSGFYGQWDGETHPEHISPASLIEMIEQHAGPGVTEFGCHPGYMDDGFSSVYHAEREVELATLCDPAVRRAIQSRRVELVGFAELRQVLSLETEEHLR